MLTLTTEQMKRAEALTDKAGLSYYEMMINAGLKSFEFIDLQFNMADKRCVLLCGSGNNGGDGFVIAKKLCEIGCSVTVVMCNGSVKGIPADAAFELICNDKRIKRLNLYENDEEILTCINSATVIVDAIFGIGFNGDLSDELKALLVFANKAAGERISLDIPTGMEADSGKYHSNCFRPNTTLVFGALKPANSNEISKRICGRVVVFDVGIPNDIMFIVQNDVALISQDLVTSIIPKRNQHTHKGNYGRLVNIAGSADMCGAAIMSTLGAMRCGAGLTTLISTRYVASVVAPHIMEATTYGLAANERGGLSADDIGLFIPPLTHATACLVGCGMMATDSTKLIVENIIKNTSCSLVLDADALNVVSMDLKVLNYLNAPAIITPHVAEMARLASLTVEQVQKNSMETAKTFAREHNVIVVLKTNRTVIATPSGEIYQNVTGNAGLAKGGSGDVLAGMIAGLLAQNMRAVDAAICGVYLHGLAADSLACRMSEYSILARDVLGEIPAVMKSLDR